MTRRSLQEPRRSRPPDPLVARRRREFHDVRHPAHPDLRVEQVQVCPSGVHVVTSVPDAGTPASGSGVVVHARLAADLVAALLPPRYRDRVRPVLCRTDRAEVADLVDGLLVTSPVPLEHILRSSPVVLSTSEVDEIALRLGTRLEPFPVAQVAERRTRRWWWALLAGGLAAVGGAASAAAQGLIPFPPGW